MMLDFEAEIIKMAVKHKKGQQYIQTIKKSSNKKKVR